MIFHTVFKDKKMQCKFIFIFFIFDEQVKKLRLKDIQTGGQRDKVAHKKLRTLKILRNEIFL